MKFGFFPEGVAKICEKISGNKIILSQLKNNTQRFFYCADRSYSGSTYFEQFGYVVNNTITEFINTTVPDTACEISQVAGHGDIVISRPAIGLSMRRPRKSVIWQV